MLSQFERRHATSYGAAAVSSKSICRQTLTAAGATSSLLSCRLAVSCGRSNPELDHLIASASLVEPLRTNCAPQRYQEVGMTGSLIWLALVGLITVLYVKKLSILDKVLGLGTIDPLAGFGAITSHLVVSFHFAKQGFENVVRIIKR
jgi:hypothetical protein